MRVYSFHRREVSSASVTVEDLNEAEELTDSRVSSGWNVRFTKELEPIMEDHEPLQLLVEGGEIQLVEGSPSGLIPIRKISNSGELKNSVVFDGIPVARSRFYNIFNQVLSEDISELEATIDELLSTENSLVSCVSELKDNARD